MTSGNPDADYCSALVGWDKLAGGRVVDFDVSVGTEPADFPDRLEVLRRLAALRERFPAGSFQRSRIGGHVAYLRATLGERAAFPDYVADTQAIPAERFRESYLDERRALLSSALGAVGVRYDSRLRDELRAVEAPVAPSDVGDFLAYAAAGLRRPIEAAVGPLDFAFRTEVVSVDEYWSAWADIADGVYRLRLNARRRPPRTETEATLLAFHEVIGHFGQMHCYRREIAGGRLAPSFGITTVHTLEQFTFEGVAQTLPLWLTNPADLDPPLLAHLRLHHYAQLVKHNLHVMINTGVPTEECVGYGIAHLPYLTTVELLADLESRSINPLYRSYQFVYPTAMDTMVRAVERIDLHRRCELLKELYRAPLAHREFQDRAGLAGLALGPT